MRFVNELHETDIFAATILNALAKFPSLNREYIFSGYISESDFISQLAFQYFEIYFTFEEDERETLRQFFGDDEAGYARATKAFEKIVVDGGKHLERLGLSDKRDPILLKDLSASKVHHLEGRPIPKIYLKAIENYERNSSNRPIYSFFKQGMIKSVKKSSNSTVINAFNEYSQELQAFSCHNSDWLINSIDIFQMEEQVPISLIYQLANYMYDNSIPFPDLDIYRLNLFKVIPITDSNPNSMKFQNNFICHNKKLFPVLFADEETYQYELIRLKSILWARHLIAPLLIMDPKLRKFIKTAPRECLVYFFKENYNLFDLIKLPDSGKLRPEIIRLIRKISSAFLVC